MRLPLLGLTLLLGLAACSKPSASGVITDGLTGGPVADLRLIANATTAASNSCSVLEAHTDSAGAFAFEGLCKDVAYQLKPGNENIWLAEGDTLPANGGTGITFKAWHAPLGRGIFRLTNNTLEIVKSSADIDSEPIWNNETEKVFYPSVLPKTAIPIPTDGYVVLVGEESVDQLVFHPLIPSGARKFGSSKGVEVSMKPWAYIGIEFASDTEFTRKEATLDASKVTTIKTPERQVSWIKGDALPAGRYVVHKDGDTRTTVLEFGKAAE